MSLEKRKSRTPPSEADNVTIIVRELESERVGMSTEGVTLKDVPLEERKKEAEKPLFLARYE